jgi:hypothetical protein
MCTSRAVSFPTARTISGVVLPMTQSDYLVLRALLQQVRGKEVDVGLAVALSILFRRPKPLVSQRS